MNVNRINRLRHVSRKLIRELGILELNKGGETPSHWHALIEISKEPHITVSRLRDLLLLSTSGTSRVVTHLIKGGLVTFKDGADKREKCLQLTEKGHSEIKKIDEFSNTKIEGAFVHLREEEQEQIVQSIEKYSNALEKSRLSQERPKTKIHTLSTSRTLRKQIIALIEMIQKEEYAVSITPEINLCILKAEEEFCYNHSCNFWYATNGQGTIVGTIGLKKLNTNSAELKKCFVVKEELGKGVAQNLLDTLIASARKHGFRTVYLGSLDQAKIAHRFYERNGFSRILRKDLPACFKALDLDSVFFKKVID